jgi:hypothetical protein
MWTPSFWKDAAERAIRTFAQALLALIGTDLVGIVDLDWPQLLAVGATAAVVSLLTSVVATGVGEKGTASLISSPEPGDE